MADAPEPITRLEKYWNAILDKITGGGSAPVLETIYCEADSKPDGWETGWNQGITAEFFPVVWGQKTRPW